MYSKCCDTKVTLSPVSMCVCNEKMIILKNGAPNIFLDVVIECNGLHVPNRFCDTISPFFVAESTHNTGRSVIYEVTCSLKIKN